MIIVMKVESTKKDIDHVLESIEKVGLKGVVLQGTNRNVIAVIGDERILPADFWDVLPGVEKT
ncbi:MAG: 3-deoxy-7-phosphoheptulonate synthase, partial [Planctomycetota bacterium]